MKMFILLLTLIVGTTGVSSIRKLGKYNVDPHDLSISGFSSGGGMAMQMHVSHSALFKGTAIFAGIPYSCGNHMDRLECLFSPVNLNATDSITDARNYEKHGLIDPLSNIRASKVFIYHGTLDNVVKPEAAEKSEKFYQEFGADLKTVLDVPGGHGMPTLNYGFECSSNEQPFLNNCNRSGAFEALSHIHGPLKQPHNTSQLTGQLFEFDQTDFRRENDSLAPSGYVYVPERCSRLTITCRLHVVFHGCTQGSYEIGNRFAVNAGYNTVADANDFIIIYPQIMMEEGRNPYGCWDWIGSTDTYFELQRHRK